MQDKKLTRGILGLWCVHCVQRALFPHDIPRGIQSDVDEVTYALGITVYFLLVHYFFFSFFFLRNCVTDIKAWCPKGHCVVPLCSSPLCHIREFLTILFMFNFVLDIYFEILMYTC